MIKFTIATPTYNRAKVLYRVYESLNAQTYKNFEWIIVDDGSKDETANIVKEWIQQAAFPIHYYYQENAGKHTAMNLAVQHAVGEFFINADSDDRFKPDALKTLLDYWNTIPENDRYQFRGVTCRCYNSTTGIAVGSEFHRNPHDLLGLDAKFKFHYNFEMWGFNRTDVMKEFPFPDIRNQGLAFYPETIIWDRMGTKYKVRFINDALLEVYHDQANATTAKHKNRSKENIHLWEHYINDVLAYFKYDPLQFIKAFIGLIMDGLLLHKSYKDIICIPNSLLGKIMVCLFSPIGYMLYLKRK